MSNLEEEADNREQVRRLLAELGELRYPNISYEMAYGGATPSEVAAVERVERLLRHLQNAPFELLPNGQLSEVRSALEAIADPLRETVEVLHTLYSASEMGYQAKSVGRELLIQLTVQYERLFTNTVGLIAYSGPTPITEEVSGLMSKAHSLCSDLEIAVRKTEQEATSFLRKLKQTAVEAGVAQHALFFHDQAEDYFRSAQRWLTATLAVGIGFLLALGAAGWFYVTYSPSLPMEQVVQLGIVKITAVSLAYYWVIFSGRTYRTNLHNYAVSSPL